jgi:hypothetical protein
MANAALFIGWGNAARGREEKSLAVFNDGLQYWTRLQQSGEIESFEPVALEPHGGELLGFVLIRGDRDKLNRLRTSEEWLRLNDRAAAVIDNFGDCQRLHRRGSAAPVCQFPEQYVGSDEVTVRGTDAELGQGCAGCRARPPHSRA